MQMRFPLSDTPGGATSCVSDLRRLLLAGLVARHLIGRLVRDVTYTNLTLNSVVDRKL